MRILLVGASGMVGSAVAKELEKDHEIIRASRNGEDVKVDITSVESIKRMYEQVGRVDAVISATGKSKFAPITEMTPEDLEVGVENKLKGQIHLVLLGLDYVNDGGSFTLTTGVMMDDPIRQGAATAMANGGVKAFVKSAAIEMPRGIRINSVSPSILEENVPNHGKFFAGFEPVSSKRVALAYKKSVEGAQTGQNYEVY